MQTRSRAPAAPCCSGGSHGFVIGHVCPEAQEGGPIALVQVGGQAGGWVGAALTDACRAVGSPSRLPKRPAHGCHAPWAMPCAHTPQDGDTIRIDAQTRKMDILNVDDAEMQRR